MNDSLIVGNMKTGSTNSMSRKNGKETVRDPSKTNITVPVTVALRDLLYRRARILSRDAAKHVRRLIVDDLMAAGAVTQKDAEALT
jgi:adenine/guanine phosphoribosyltransferase-like PRPP-binding protein